MAKINTQHEYIHSLIPYRLQAVAVLELALRYVEQDPPAQLAIRFDDKLVIRGLSSAFTNPAIEAGVMHCRALLEFIGLKLDRKQPDKLVERRGTAEDDDFVIEDFERPDGARLERVTPAAAVASYPDPAQAERALAAVIRAANKGVAHTTAGHLIDGDNFDHFIIASRGVPSLLITHFYTPLGLPPPKYKPEGAPNSG